MDPVTIAGQSLLGLITGVLAGLLGIGGGALLVPAMVFLLGVPQHTAQGVSLVVILPNAVVGGITHYRHGNVLPRLALTLGLASIAGSLIGASIAGMVDGESLRRAFGVFLLLMAANMIVR